MKRTKELSLTVIKTSMNPKELLSLNKWLCDVITSNCTDNKKENCFNMKA